MAKNENPLLRLGKIKDTLTDAFFEDEVIQKLIMPETDDSRFTQKQNFTGGDFPLYGSDGSIESTVSLPGHCYDVLFMKESLADDRAFLCLDTQIAAIKGRTAQIQIVIGVYAGPGMLHMPAQEKQYYIDNYGFAGNRIDMAAMAIHRMFLTSPALAESFGIGSIQLSEDENPVQNSWLNKHYCGKTLTYTIYGFNPVSGRRRQVV